MSNSGITKQAIAQSLKDLILIDKIPFSKITIKMILRKYNFAKSTFYYHFRDKYEVVNWIFYYDTQKNVDAFTNPAKLTESFINVCKYLYANRNFYYTCLLSTERNSLRDYLSRFYTELWMIHLNIRYAESGTLPPDHIIAMTAKMKSHIMTDTIADWVDDGMNDNYLDYIENLRPLLESEYWNGINIPQILHSDVNSIPMDEIIDS